MDKTILLIGTMDTKEEELVFCRDLIRRRGFKALLLDAGILKDPRMLPDVTRQEVARAAGITDLEGLVALGDKGKCIEAMIRGVTAKTQELLHQKVFDGILGIGGGQGTDICASAMRSAPRGMPKLLVSTIASGKATFGPYVGTKDIAMMHSVVDLQGLNFLIRRILVNAVSGICGMVDALNDMDTTARGIPVALSMLGTTTPGALRMKATLERRGYEVVAFHQNGTGGIAMEEMIREGAFKGVLDLNLHEIGDRFVGGLHSDPVKERLAAAGEMGIPQVIAPGSINYAVWGPFAGLSTELKSRKYIVHNPNMTLVRLSPDELRSVGRLTAEKINRAKGPTHVFIPLKGFSYPDREGLPHWDPEGNRAFIGALKARLLPSIPLKELDAHINDPAFIDPVADAFLSMMEKCSAR
ncbi:MAG TPA: Tm-1-like ATP-binding domain-containing protein [Candidatus Methylomirabilis sp.]|nr:Tm-1-like ATP-binding domain-containing protein [Candidatus Methylomirabilis sp.]